MGVQVVRLQCVVEALQRTMGDLQAENFQAAGYLCHHCCVRCTFSPPVLRLKISPYHIFSIIICISEKLTHYKLDFTWVVLGLKTAGFVWSLRLPLWSGRFLQLSTRHRKVARSVFLLSNQKYLFFLLIGPIALIPGGKLRSPKILTTCLKGLIGCHVFVLREKAEHCCDESTSHFAKGT